MESLPKEIDLSMDDSDSDSDVIIEENVQEKAESKKEEGNQLYKMKQYKQALTLYSEAIALCPENPAFYGNRSACYVMLLQYKDALADSRKAVELDPKFVKGYLRMAKCYLALGDVSASNSALQRVSELEPNNPSLNAEKEILNAVQKQVDNAYKCYDKRDYRQVVYCMDMALNSVPGCHRFKLLKAESLARIARYQEAQEIANDVLRLDSQNADAIYVRAMCLYYQDGIDKAFTHLTHILKIAPDHKNALELYKKVKALKQTKEEGNNAFSNNQWQKAYELYTQALLIDPSNAAANTKLYSNRALVCAKMNQLQKAVDDCTEALKLDETFLKALLRRAKWYSELGMLEESVYDYEKVCKLDKSRENKRLLQEAKLALKRSKWKDYYKILGVERNANDDEIRKAYRKRALVHHPDKHASKSEGEKIEQEKKFKEIGEAYAILSDPKKRARYDSGQDLDDVEFDNPWANTDACNRFPGFFGHSQQQQQQFAYGGFGGDGFRVYHLG